MCCRVKYPVNYTLICVVKTKCKITGLKGSVTNYEIIFLRCTTACVKSLDLSLTL